MTSAAQEIVAFEKQVSDRERESALKRFYNRTHYEPASDYTPFDSIISREPADLDELEHSELVERLGRYGVELSAGLSKKDIISVLAALAQNERSVQLETCNRLFLYFAADGPEPDRILRRVFASGSHMAISPYCDFTLREKKALLGGSHGTHHWLSKKACEDPLRRKGAKAWKAPGQKSLGARKNYSSAQEGNTNRKSHRT